MLYEAYDYVYTPFWQTTTCYIITITLLTIFALYFMIKRRQTPTKPISPEEWALAELAKLTPEKYLSKEEFKQFYFSMTMTTKHFLEKKFGFDVVEKTDDELIDYLHQKLFDPTGITNLQKVLHGSLLIKFANAQALKEQAQADLKTIITLINPHV